MQDDSGLVSKITSVFRAYAAGDAFGVAHEFVDDPVKNVENVLLAKDGWPYGGVMRQQPNLFLNFDWQCHICAVLDQLQRPHLALK